MALLCSKRLFNQRTTFLNIFRSNGYIVLVPEIGEDLPQKNPLLQSNGLPEFNNITIENCMAAIGTQTLDFESGVRNIEEKIIKTEPKDVFTDIIEPLEEIGSSLEMTWGLSKTLYLGNSSLMPTKSYLAIHDRAKRARSVKFNSKPIYNALKKAVNAEANISDEKNRVLRKFIVEGKLNGLELEGKDRDYLIFTLTKLVDQKKLFKQKTDISTNKFSHRIDDPVVVHDFPKKLLESMAPSPSQIYKGPWNVTLQPNIYVPVLEYCPDREIRWNVWQAFVNRGSGYAVKELRTSEGIEEIRYLRREIAKTLGYESFAQMSMETKMAGSVENVNNMLNTLLEYARPAQEEEVQNLYKFALERNFEGNRIELWDLPYWRRKQLKSLYDYNEDDFKEYFPLPKVLQGLFSLCENLFNIVIRQRGEVSTWHKDVQFYDIFEPHSSEPVAGFYLDPYARTDEKLRSPLNNGWMVGIQNRSLVVSSKPLAALIFNFQIPTSERPSLLTFREIHLLFNRFGHALQHLLTRVQYSEVSGVSNIEWDTVEVCGHVLAHLLYDKKIVDTISSHCDSEDKLPEHMFNTLMNVHKHMAGLDLCRELYLSALDLEFHYSKEFWLDIMRQLWPRYRCFPLSKEDSHPCSFTQIFSEDWAAAYFSHTWSKVIAADIYSAFYEVRNDERQTLDVAKRFRDTYLALGGACHPSQVFRKFRGRDPSPKALLMSLGLKKSKKNDK